MIPVFSRAVPGVLWCFEPVIENYILANKCIEENNLENVFLLNVALSNKVGMVKVNTSVSNKKNKGGVSPQEIGTVATYQGHRGGGAYVDGIGQPTPSITIDNFQYDSLIVIQLDIEGHELMVLKGATDTISKHLPIIMVEDNNKECSKFLENRGYSFFASIPGLKIWVNNQNTMIASVMEKLKKNMA